MKEVDESVVPDAGVNWNTACVIWREVAYPTTVMVKPPAVVAALTLVITGAREGMMRVVEGAGLGVMSWVPASSWAVTVMVPATVPV